MYVQMDFIVKRTVNVTKLASTMTVYLYSLAKTSIKHRQTATLLPQEYNSLDIIHFVR